MKLEVYKDQRFPRAKELLVSMLGKKDIENTSALVNQYNYLVCVVRETAIFICYLGDNIPFGNPIYIDCESTFALLADDPDSTKYIPILDIRKINQLNEYYVRYTNTTNYTLIYHKDNMELEPDFAEFLSIKSTDGAKFYKGISTDNCNKFMFPIFTGFPKLLKNDTLSLNVYMMDNLHYMIEMDIFKMKIKGNIKLIYRVLNVS